MSNIRRLIGLPVLLALLPWQVKAVQTGDSINIEFGGRMMPLMACQISGDQVMDVMFEHVAINKIDSGKFIRQLPYSLDNCSSAANTVQMLFKAMPSGFDKTVIGTSVEGLGVKIFSDGKALPINQFLKVADPQSPPMIEMHLVKAPGVELKEGPFTAAGTLLAEYP